LSHRRHVLQVLGVITAIGLLFAAFAGVADAKRYTPRHKAQVRKELKRAVKKNPKVVFRKSFLKKARAVDFVLPITIRIGRKVLTGPTTSTLVDPGSATLDLGPSLGTRTLSLTGHLPAEIQFADSYDGGGLGNVKLRLNPSGTSGAALQTTSLPLLSNNDVSGVTRGSDPLTPGTGCSDFTATGESDAFGNGAGVDAIDNLTSSTTPGSENNLGAGPYSPDNTSNPQNVVLRTGSLSLAISQAGQTIHPPGNLSATVPNDYVVGQSGGTANLFGNIPGKDTQVDVTANLQTDIRSILREVDSGATQGTTAPAGVLGGNYGNNPPALLDCRQAWTGFVRNYLPAIHLTGNLHISPAITADGRLRIAKTTLGLADPARISVAACLIPFYGYANEQDPALNAGNPLAPGSKPAPPAPCNTTPVGIVHALGVNPLSAPAPGSGYTTTDNGSQVAVSAEISALSIPQADILIGANQF
jgi:hypothetical protein